MAMLCTKHSKRGTPLQCESSACLQHSHRWPSESLGTCQQPTQGLAADIAKGLQRMMPTTNTRVHVVGHKVCNESLKHQITHQPLVDSLAQMPTQTAVPFCSV